MARTSNRITKYYTWKKLSCNMNRRSAFRAVAFAAIAYKLSSVSYNAASGHATLDLNEQLAAHDETGVAADADALDAPRRHLDFELDLARASHLDPLLDDEL